MAVTVCRTWSFVILLACIASPLAAQDDDSCMICHADADLTKTLPNGRVVSLYIDKEIYDNSVHAPNGCISCHFDVSDLPHGPELKPVMCGGCHSESEEFANSLHGQALGHGVEDAAGCADCHGIHDIRKADDPLSKVHPVNLPDTCGTCHTDPDMVQRLMISQFPLDGYLKSTHAQLILLEGRTDAASCNDCHGTHNLRPAHDPASEVYWSNVPATCGKCHPQEQAEFENSIHGKALRAGIQDAPNCTDCHGEHDIEAPDSATSTVSPMAVSRDTCFRCHDDENVMSKYGVPLHRQGSYMDSFHGATAGAGSEVVASCVSCHGVHNILPQSDTAASIHPDNLPGTCAQCHPDSNANFASGSVHVIPTAPGQKLLGIVRTLYLTLIVGTIGAMLLHNFLMFARQMVNRLKAERKGSDTYRRFVTGELIGHLALAISFIALTLSGFALRYPDAWWAKLVFPGEGGLELRGTVHRIAALALVAIAVANFVYLALTKRGRREFRALIPKLRDVRDGIDNIDYFVGIHGRKPRWGRYGYIEKLEYWGMWWGTVLMIITGFCMWYPETTLRYMPKLFLDLMDLIHYYEAWLAVLTILVWHMYHVALDPDTYPMNWSWLTGHITKDELKHRHPLEYESEFGQSDSEGDPRI